MSFSTKINLNSNKVEQSSGETLNLSGITQVYNTGQFIFKSGSSLSMLSNTGNLMMLTGATIQWTDGSYITSNGLTGATGVQIDGDLIILNGNTTSTKFIEGSVCLSNIYQAKFPTSGATCSIAILTGLPSTFSTFNFCCGILKSIT